MLCILQLSICCNCCTCCCFSTRKCNTVNTACQTQAQQLLKAAVKQEHAGSAVTDKLVCGIADALIDLGLSRRQPAGFHLECVNFSTVGIQLTKLKQKIGLSKPLSKLMTDLGLHRYFTLSKQHRGDKLLSAVVPELLPNANSTVQALLPGVQWHAMPAQIAPPSVSPADTVAGASLQPPVPSTQQLTTRQMAIQAPSATLPAQFAVQQAVANALPLAAVVVDLGLRHASADMRRLHIVQVTRCMRVQRT